jgi:hypothetical protein
MSENRLQDIRQGIQEGFDTGTLLASYAIVGGGSFWVIEAETEAVVNRILRTLGVKNAEVTPVVRTLDLIDAHVEQRRNTIASGPRTNSP